MAYKGVKLQWAEVLPCESDQGSLLAHCKAIEISGVLRVVHVYRRVLVCPAQIHFKTVKVSNIFECCICTCYPAFH